MESRCWSLVLNPMRTLLALAWCLVATSVMAANPTLTNFNARHFIVTPFGNPTNVIVLNLNPNQFIPGASTITIDMLWTNASGAYRPLKSQSSVSVTGLVSAVTLTASGAFKIPSTSQLALTAPTTNNINTLNQGFIILSSDANTTNATDRPISLNSGNGQGQILMLENKPFGGITQSAFALLDGTPTWDGVGAITLANGNWLPTRTGETILLQNDGTDWREITRFFGSSGGTSIIPDPFLSVANLGGNPPALDGSVATVAVWDSDSDFMWVNIGSKADPIWKAH